LFLLHLLLMLLMLLWRLLLLLGNWCCMPRGQTRFFSIGPVVELIVVLSGQRMVDSISRVVELVVVLFGQQNINNMRLGRLQVGIVSELPERLGGEGKPDRPP